MATVKSRRPLLSLRQAPTIGDFEAPNWFERLPKGVGTAGILIVLVAISALIRARYLTGELWSDEANVVGVASHSLSAIPGILRAGGGAPLYPMLLHLWIGAVGTSESAVHGLSMLFGLLSIPAAMWIGWSLLGRRAGYMAAMLFAFNSFLTRYASEARPYELMALLGLLALGSFLLAFVYRRRGHLPLFVVSLLALLYTDAWSAFFYVATAAALVVVLLTSEDRPGVARDGLIAFGVAGILFVPWLPTLIHQAGHATAPWHYAPLLSATVPRDLLGSDRVDVVLGIAAAIGFATLLPAALRRTPEATVVWVLVTVSVVALALARLLSLLAPAWISRYLGPVAAAMMLLGAVGCVRSGVIGLVAIVLACAFTVNASSFVAQYKSDMRDISGELSAQLRAGDMVFVAQPEQTTLAWYYLPGGLRYATTLGDDSRPGYMNWDDAMTRLSDANPVAGAARVIGSLAPGRRLLFLRPLTEGERAWAKPWSALVRRRSAQWAMLLAENRSLVPIPGATAPHSYRGACCIASSATLYVKR